jgi:hypothetical protein
MNIDDEVMMLAEIFILRLEMAMRRREDPAPSRDSRFVPFRPDAFRVSEPETGDNEKHRKRSGAVVTLAIGLGDRGETSRGGS